MLALAGRLGRRTADFTAASLPTRATTGKGTGGWQQARSQAGAPEEPPATWAARANFTSQASRGPGLLVVLDAASAGNGSTLQVAGRP